MVVEDATAEEKDQLNAAEEESANVVVKPSQPSTEDEPRPRTEEPNLRLVFVIAAGAFGSAFQHGYNTGVVNAPQLLITDWIASCEYAGRNATEAESSLPAGVCMGKKEVTMIWALVVSFFSVGGMFGGAAISFVADYFGRKGGLLANNALMAAGGGLMLASKFVSSYQLLILGRFVMGINAGINAGIAPMYLSEIAPTAVRGAVGTVYQLIITISILLAQVLGMRSVLGNDWGWPWLLFLTVIPGFLQLMTLPFCPESPRYLLLNKDDENRAVVALTWLRGKIEVYDELNEIKSEQESMKSVGKVSLKEMLMTAPLRQPLIIAVMMMLAQQLTGINAAIYFSTSIFRSAGLDENKAQIATLGMGTCNVLMTFVSLILIERAGRKTLMLTGLGAMQVTTVMLLICLLVGGDVFSYLSVVMVILFVVGFAIGPGSIPWFFVTELFSQAGRPTATATAVVVNWVANFLVGLLFEPIKYAIGSYVFLIFIVMQILFMVYVKVKVPETKNKTIEEITAQFRQPQAT